MKTITIKIIQWTDIRQWWLDRFGVKTIKGAARDACDFIEGTFNHDLEKILEKHYGDDLFNRNPEVYNDCICELKTRLVEICNAAKEIIHV